MSASLAHFGAHASGAAMESEPRSMKLALGLGMTDALQSGDPDEQSKAYDNLIDVIYKYR